MGEGIRPVAFALLFAAALTACAGPSESTSSGTASTTETAESAASTATEPESASAGRMVDGYYIAEGAPAPRECATDADCVASGILADGGCCWSYRNANLVPQSNAYRDWTNTQRAACDTAACGPPPAPAQPADCLFEVSCDAGQCVNACP